MLAQPIYDFTIVADQGRRDEQEDAINARFVEASGLGYVVVSDGMGGHDAGDVASDIVVSTWQSIFDKKIETEMTEETLLNTLPVVAMQANAAVANYSAEHESEIKLGATLLGAVFIGKWLYWISIGDSPLYLFRDGKLSRLNADHSMAPELDEKVARGLMDWSEAQNHPSRNILTSVIMGAAIPKVDCVSQPMEMKPGDVILIASDGLQYVKEHIMQAILNKIEGANSEEIAYALMRTIEHINDPDQDNVSLGVVVPVIN